VVAGRSLHDEKKPNLMERTSQGATIVGLPTDMEALKGYHSPEQRENPPKKRQ